MQNCNVSAASGCCNMPAPALRYRYLTQAAAQAGSAGAGALTGIGLPRSICQKKMLQQARENQAADCYQSGDIEALPFADARFDRCWSNLAVQWCSDLSQALRELRRVTKPGGQVLFSTLTEGSLNEVSAAWQHLGRSTPLNRFASLPVIEQAAAGMMLASYTLTLAFPDVLSALRSLKGIGATHLHQGRADSMLSRRELQRLEQVWQRDARGCLLSYQLVSGVIECE
ncbi:Ubiquinone/menaquinone biosynthesis methyltransferase ubiE [Erwinia amylovora Ea644]|nr:Ubiquinone/menaquinone biosynthesis methyltransferase ubiE [Erwinia amylovora Ea644]